MPKESPTKKAKTESPKKENVIDLTGKSNLDIRAVVVLPDDDHPEDECQFRLNLGKGDEEDDFLMFHGLVLCKKAKGKASLSELQGAVGGSIETVRPSNEIQKTGWHTMYVNEEGLLKELPFNNNASAIALCTFTNPLVGRVVLCRNKM